MRRSRFVLVLMFAAIAMSAAAAHAQSQRSLGLVVAFPSAVGVQWQARENVAIRFDAGYDQSSSESTFGSDGSLSGIPVFGLSNFAITTENSRRRIDLGLSILIDVHRRDALRLYLAPRIGVQIVQNTFETRIGGLSPAALASLTFPANEETSSSAPGGSLAFGAAHDLGERFRVFGEGGLEYIRGTIDALRFGDTTHRSFGLRSGIGVIVLF